MTIYIIEGFLMDVDEAMEPAVDNMSGAATAEVHHVSSVHKSDEPRKDKKRSWDSTDLSIVDNVSATTEMQREMDELFMYYKEVSGHQLNPEELPCSRIDSFVACLLEESSLSFAKLTDQILKRLKLQDGFTESSVRSLVLRIGKRVSYGISKLNVDALGDESESSLWCWETQDLVLLPSHLHDFLSIRRKARGLIHERIVDLSVKLPAKDTHSTHGIQKIQCVRLGGVLNIDEIRTFIEKLNHRNDAEITDAQCKTMIKESEANKNAVKDKQKIEHQSQKELRKKDRELKLVKEKAEKEERRIERENKRLKKEQKEVEREKKRQEKEQAELKRKASIQRQANLMENFLKGEANSTTENYEGHHSILSENTGEPAVAATSAIDCILLQDYCLEVDKVWLEHVSRWRKLAQNKRLCHWAVRRSPKVQPFRELKLQKPSTSAPSDKMMSNSTKEQSSQEQGSPLEKASYGNEIPCTAAEEHSLYSVSFAKKLLQFDGSNRPSFYGIWRKQSSTVNGRQPFKRDPYLNYEVDSDEEWEEEGLGERLSDFEKDDEEILNDDDCKIDVEEETDNSFVVPNDHLSEDEGVQYELLSGKFDDTCSVLTTSWVTVEEFNILLHSMKALNSLTEEALRKDRPLVISNLDHRKLYLLEAEDITETLKVEKLCLQALRMRECPGGVIIDEPTDVIVSLEYQEFSRANKGTPRASKSISDTDMPEFVKLITSCSYGMNKLVDLLLGTFPCVSKAQLKKKIREIAEFSNNHWQVKKDILDRYGFSFSLDTHGCVEQTTPCFSQSCHPPDVPGKSGDSSLEPVEKFVVDRTQIGDQELRK